MVTIGLTGGIGAGKSIVSKYLASKGFGLVDADAAAHRITERGEPALKELAETFGREIIMSDGNLNRAMLADIVFRDEKKKKILNEITHRHIMRVMDAMIESFKAEGKVKGIVIDAVLLLESKYRDLTDENWVVTANEDLRVKRTMLRDNVTEEQVMNRIQSQTKDKEKLAKADKVLDNSGSKEELYAQVDELLKRLKERQ